MDNIKYENFKNICRMCMLDCCINFTKDAVITDIYHKLTNIHFVTNYEIPQQICLKCFEFINEIHRFSMTCKHTHSVLMKCLNKQTNREVEIIEETDEEMGIFDDIIGEHEIQLDNDGKTYDSLNENVFELAVDLLPPISTNIQEESINAINSNGFKKDSNLLDSVSSIHIMSLRNREKITKKNKSKIYIETSKRECKSEYISEHTPVPETSKNVQRRHYKCNQCNKYFVGLYRFKVHKRVHSGEHPYKCDQCEKTFAILGNLKVHKRGHSGERPFVCDQCGKSFAQLASLKNHKRVHSGERPYLCDECGKSFTEMGHLKTHKHLHSDDDPYICDECGKSFKQLYGFIRHKRLHSGERPYKCDQCGKSFVDLRCLKIHKHVHSGDHSYKCDQCEKSFKQPFSLLRHKRLHSGARPYKCDQCEKSFTDSRDLKSHKHEHGDEHPYKCDLCGKTFTRPNTLQTHKRMHTGERPFKCDIENT